MSKERKSLALCIEEAGGLWGVPVETRVRILLQMIRIVEDRHARNEFGGGMDLGSFEMQGNLTERNLSIRSVRSSTTRDSEPDSNTLDATSANSPSHPRAEDLLAPEVRAGNRPDRNADTFALASIGLFVLTGRIDADIDAGYPFDVELAAAVDSLRPGLATGPNQRFLSYPRLKEALEASLRDVSKARRKENTLVLLAKHGGETLLAAAAVISSLFLLIDPAGVGARLVKLDYDLMHRTTFPGSAPPLEEVTVIKMDERSYDELGQPRSGSWDRSLHARLIDKLTEFGARAIAFDVLFIDGYVPQAHTRALADSMSASGQVVVAATIEAGGVGSIATNRLILPTELIAAAAVPGIVEHADSPDLGNGVPGISKHVGAFHDTPGFAEAALIAASMEPAAAREGRLWIRHYGPQGTLPSVSYVDVLNNADSFADLIRGRSSSSVRQLATSTCIALLTPGGADL